MHRSEPMDLTPKKYGTPSRPPRRLQAGQGALVSCHPRDLEDRSNSGRCSCVTGRAYDGGPARATRPEPLRSTGAEGERSHCGGGEFAGGHGSAMPDAGVVAGSWRCAGRSDQWKDRDRCRPRRGQARDGCRLGARCWPRHTRRSAGQHHRGSRGWRSARDLAGHARAQAPTGTKLASSRRSGFERPREQTPRVRSMPASRSQRFADAVSHRSMHADDEVIASTDRRDHSLVCRR